VTEKGIDHSGILSTYNLKAIDLSRGVHAGAAAAAGH
jgi:hypothetical protein